MGNDILLPPISSLTVPLVFTTFLKFHWRAPWGAVGSSTWRVDPTVWSHVGVVLAEPVGCPHGSSLWRMTSCRESPLLRLWGGEWRGRSDRVEVLWTHYNPHSPSHCAAEMWGRGRRVRNKGENLSLGRMWGEREVFQFSVFLPILLNFTYQ